jgi:ketosteroid isomerase-like protein
MSQFEICAFKDASDVAQGSCIDAFNRADVDALATHYHADATNHQVAESPVHGPEAIRAMFKAGFDTTEMVCRCENLFEDGEWAILE